MKLAKEVFNYDSFHTSKEVLKQYLVSAYLYYYGCFHTSKEVLKLIDAIVFVLNSK